MTATDGTSCGTSGSCKGRFCGMIFKLVLAGLLTCIASSLWEIEKALNKISVVEATKK